MSELLLLLLLFLPLGFPLVLLFGLLFSFELVQLLLCSLQMAVDVGQWSV